MPPAVKKCVKSVLEDNPDYSESRAYAICWAEQNRGNLSVSEDATHDELLQAAAKRDEECPEGKVRAGQSCVDVKEVGVPPSILSTPQHLTLKSLETEPIERVDEDEDTVRYKSLKLLSPGVWADAGSQTETYYPPDGIAALEPDYDESEHDGPPVNIMHDLDVDAWEAHEASVAGHIDPDTLGTDDDGNLYGDIVFNTAKGAGQFADENLQSTLEKEGTVGFGGPSVEIPARGLQQSHDEVRDMPRVDGGLLTGVAMVMDPASKSVNFAREAARRPVALSNGASGESGKVLTRQDGSMRTKLLEGIADNLTLEDADELRETLDMFGFDGLDEMTDDEVMDMAEDLHEDLMNDLEGEGDGEGEEDTEMGDYEDDEDEDEDDEDTEMQEGEDIDAMREQMQNLSERLEDVEDALSQAMTEDDVSQELEDAAGNKLADIETVQELEDAKEELNRRLEALEDEPAESKTLADNNSSIDWSDADDGVDYDPATGSISR